MRSGHVLSCPRAQTAIASCVLFVVLAAAVPVAPDNMQEGQGTDASTRFTNMTWLESFDGENQTIPNHVAASSNRFAIDYYMTVAGEGFYPHPNTSSTYYNARPHPRYAPGESLSLHDYIDRFAGKDGNVFVSPLGTYMMFSILYEYMEGEAAEELERIFGFEPDAAKRAEYAYRTMHAMNKDILPLVPKEPWDPRFERNAQSIPKDTPIHYGPLALYMGTKMLDFSAYGLDYGDEALPDMRRAYVVDAPHAIYLDQDDTIYPWSRLKGPHAESTASARAFKFAFDPPKLDFNFSPKDDDPSHWYLFSMYNALRFDGSWAVPFDPANTRQGSFRTAQGSMLRAEFMHMVDEFDYKVADGMRVLRMPYEGGRSMVLLLQDGPGGVAGIEERLSPEALKEWTGGMHRKEVLVTIPKFDIQMNYDLKKVLSLMGVTHAIDGAEMLWPDGEEWDEHPGRYGKGWIDAAQKIHVRMDEGPNKDGPGADAGRIGISHDAEFVADRPFMFVILDDESGAILFLGKVSNVNSERHVWDPF